MGYSTPEHYAGLDKHGPCLHHRRSFAPIHNILYPQDPVDSTDNLLIQQDS